MTGVFANLAVILAVVLWGSLVPQGLPPEIYLERYGAGLGNLFLQLGLDDVFHSRGFALIGTILFLQLGVCTWRRLRLLRAGLRLWVAGSVLLHIGLMIFLTSVGLSLWQGRIITIDAAEGKTVKLADAGIPFDLRLEKFTIEYYPGQSAVRQYRSEVSLLQDDKAVKREILEVNSPLEFHGVKIFQMSYGWVVEGSVRRLPDGAPEAFAAASGAWVPWSGSADTPLRIAAMTDPDRGGADKLSAVFLVMPAGGARRSGLVAAGETAVSGNLEIRFDRLIRSSGLQLKIDPGIRGIFTGLAVALIGLILRYLPLRREQA